MRVRAASEDDLDALRDLRNRYVAQSHAVFDERPLSGDDERAWFATFRERGPHRLRVAWSAERLVGYCSSQPYRAHPAFSRTIETSVCCDPQHRDAGVGSMLYRALFAALADEPLHRAVAGIALPNDASIALRARFGFTPVGVFDEYAVKNGVFLSSRWMQRPLP